MSPDMVVKHILKNDWLLMRLDNIAQPYECGCLLTSTTDWYILITYLSSPHENSSNVHMLL